MDKKYVFAQSGEQVVPTEQPAKKDRFSSMLKELMEVPFSSAKETRDTKRPSDKKEDEDVMQFVSGTTVLDEVKRASPVDDRAEQPEDVSFTPVPAKPREESLIGKDIVINGSISSVSNIRIDGTVNGNVACENDVTVSGTIEGDVSGNTVRLLGGQVKGDISCKSGLAFDKDAVVNGNVTGKKLEINGKIKGNINVELSAVIMGNAMIIGDVVASSISVAEGALIKGNIQINRNYDQSETA